MNKNIHNNLELFIDSLIPSVVFILLIVISLELFFDELINQYKSLILSVNIFIVVIFVLNLIFKYRHLKNFPKFLKNYWLDILVIFPFFLVIRFVEGFGLFFKLEKIATKTQKVLHTGLEIEKEVVLILEEEKKEKKHIHKIINRISKRWPLLFNVIRKIHKKTN